MLDVHGCLKVAAATRQQSDVLAWRDRRRVSMSPATLFDLGSAIAFQIATLVMAPQQHGVNLCGLYQIPKEVGRDRQHA